MFCSTEAALQLEMIRRHRADIRSARELAPALTARLQDAAGTARSSSRKEPKKGNPLHAEAIPICLLL